MAGLTIKPDREEYVAFSDSYYKASQKLIVPSDNTEFDECKTADDVNAILNAKDSSSKIGFRQVQPDSSTAKVMMTGDSLVLR